jgi:drug/metabolite transporter (DMT)-like permease
VLVGVASLETGALGNILIVVNMIAYSMYLVSARDLLHRYHPLTVITWIFIFGAVILLPLGLPAAVREFPHTSLLTRVVLAGIVLLPTVRTTSTCGRSSGWSRASCRCSCICSRSSPRSWPRPSSVSGHPCGWCPPRC